MGKQVHRTATAVITVAGLALLLAVMSSVALVTRTEPLVSQQPWKAVVTERMGK